MLKSQRSPTTHMGNLPATVLSLPGGGALAAEPVTVAVAEPITWSGIALHGGALPGYPASHGCVRLPFDFAARLFDATAMGMPVIVAPTDVAPVEIAHAVLFQPKPSAGVLAAARSAEAEEAARKAVQARLDAGTAYREATRAMMPGARGGKSEAQSRGPIGGRREAAKN